MKLRGYEKRSYVIKFKDIKQKNDFKQACTKNDLSMAQMFRLLIEDYVSNSRRVGIVGYSK